METKKNITVNKPIEDVWEILGHQFTEADRWARGLYHSEGSGAPKVEGAHCNNRVCDTSFGRIKEEIITFDSKGYKLSYKVVDGFPGFIKLAVNNWKLTKINDRQTTVEIHFKGDTTGILGAIMGPMMGIKLNKALGEALEDFKHYVETGNPSSGKVRDKQKQAKKAA